MSFGRKCISVFTLAAAFFAFSTFAMAQETPTDKPSAVKKDGKRKHARKGRHAKRGKHGRRGRRGMRGMRGRRGGGALRGITLTDSQKTQLQTLFQSRRGQGRKNNEELRSLMMARRSGLATTEQEARLKQLMTEMRAKRKADREKMSADVRAVLTPDQQQQYDKNLTEMKTRMEARKKRMEERKKMRMEKKKMSQPKEVG